MTPTRDQFKGAGVQARLHVTGEQPQTLNGMPLELGYSSDVSIRRRCTSLRALRSLLRLCPTRYVSAPTNDRISRWASRRVRVTPAGQPASGIKAKSGGVERKLQGGILLGHG